MKGDGCLVDCLFSSTLFTTSLKRTNSESPKRIPGPKVGNFILQLFFWGGFFAFGFRKCNFMANQPTPPLTYPPPEIIRV